jgi:lysophospholipase L1-like esterase
MGNYIFKISIVFNVLILIVILALSFYLDLPGKAVRHLFKSKINIVMIGDSRLNTDWNELMGRNDIELLHGGQIENIMPQIDSISKLNPKYCMIMIGANDMFWRKTPQKAFEDYKLMVDRMFEKNIKIIIESVIYVCPAKLFYKEQNKEIDELNSMLERYCKEKGVYFFNINEKLSESGYLKKEYSSDDVHINDKGYQVWRSELLPLFKSLKL